MQLIENVLVSSWPTDLPPIPTQFERMTYQQATETYGSDKPDTRSTEFLVSMFGIDRSNDGDMIYNSNETLK